MMNEDVKCLVVVMKNSRWDVVGVDGADEGSMRGSWLRKERLLNPDVDVG